MVILTKKKYTIIIKEKEELEKKISSLENDKLNAQKRIAELQKENYELKKENKDLENQLKNKEEQAKVLKQTIETYEKGLDSQTYMEEYLYGKKKE